MAKAFMLTQKNYHSPGARKRWFSSSDVKQASRCESEWDAVRKGRIKRCEDKPAFLFGHLFEQAVTSPGVDTLHYINAHPELLASRGTNKGALRAEFLPAMECAAAVRRSPYLRGILRRSRKQMILTGTIDGLPMRAMMDLVDKDGSIYDLKTARDFRPIWDDARGEYTDWWAYWRYPMQMWVYRELARQNGIEVPQVGLIAASKADQDVAAIRFGKETMAAAEADVHYTLERMKVIIEGREEPLACGVCPWCISRKRITGFEEI